MAPVQSQHNIEDPVVNSVRNSQENKIQNKSTSEQSNKDAHNNEQPEVFEKPIPNVLTQFKNSVVDPNESESLKRNFSLVVNVDTSKNETISDETIGNVNKKRPSLCLKAPKKCTNKLTEVNIKAESNVADGLKSETIEDNICLVNNIDTTNSKTIKDETNENVYIIRPTLDLKSPKQITNELPEGNVDEICSVIPEIKEEKGFYKYTSVDVITIDSDEEELPYSQIFDLGQHDQQNQSDIWYEEYRKDRDGSEEEAEVSSEVSEVNSIDEGWFQRLSQCNATDLESGINEDIIYSKPTSLIDDEEFDVTSKFEDHMSRGKALEMQNFFKEETFSEYDGKQNDFNQIINKDHPSNSKNDNTDISDCKDIAVKIDISSTKNNNFDEITRKSKNKRSVYKFESKVREEKSVKNQLKPRRSKSRRIIDSSEEEEEVMEICDSGAELTTRDKSYKQEKRKHSSAKSDLRSRSVSPSKDSDREKYMKVHLISNMTNENINCNEFGQLIREKSNEDQVKNKSKDIKNLETPSISSSREVKRKLSADTDESTSSSSNSSKHKKKYKIHSAQQEKSELNVKTGITINKPPTITGKKFKASKNIRLSPHSDSRNNLNTDLSKDLSCVASENLLDIILADIKKHDSSPDSSDLSADEDVIKFNQSKTIAKSINQYLVDFEDQIVPNKIVRNYPDQTLLTGYSAAEKKLSTNKETISNFHKLDDDTKLTAVNKKILDSHKKTPVPIIQALNLPSRKRQASIDMETKSNQDPTRKKLLTETWYSKVQSNKSNKQLSKSEIKAIRSEKLKLINKPKHSLEETKSEDKTKQIKTAKSTTKITDRSRSEILLDTLNEEKSLKENETLKEKGNHDSKRTNQTKESKTSLSSFKIPRRTSTNEASTTISNTSSTSATSTNTNNVLKPCNSSAKPTDEKNNINVTIPLKVTNEPTNVPVLPLEEDCLSLVDTKLTHQISNTALNKLKTRVAHVPPPISDFNEKEPILVKLLPDKPNSKPLQDINFKSPKKSNLKRLGLQKAKEKRTVKFNHSGDDPLTVYVQMRNFELDCAGTFKKVTKSGKKERIPLIEKTITVMRPHIDYSLETFHQICKWNCNWFEVSKKYYLFSFNHNKTSVN